LAGCCTESKACGLVDRQDFFDPWVPVSSFGSMEYLTDLPTGATSPPIKDVHNAYLHLAFHT
jgi:hypothetical protein